MKTFPQHSIRLLASIAVLAVFLCGTGFGKSVELFNTNGTYPTNYVFWDDVHPTT